MDHTNGSVSINEFREHLTLFSNIKDIIFSTPGWRICSSKHGDGIEYVGVGTCCPWSHGLQPKSFKLVWRCDQLLSGFLANCQLPRVSLKVGVTMWWYRGLCKDLLAFALQLRKTSARRPSMKAVWAVEVPYLQIRSVGSHSTPGREKEGKDGVEISLVLGLVNNWM